MHLVRLNFICQPIEINDQDHIVNEMLDLITLYITNHHWQKVAVMRTHYRLLTGYIAKLFSHVITASTFLQKGR